MRNGMRVLTMFPPNYKDIVRAFPVRGHKVLFCYGDTIYNPGKMKIPPQLYPHEAVHQERQGGDPDGWWRRYIADPGFRLDEEIPAHKAELAFLCSKGWRDIEPIARRLASPLYGSMLTLDQAMEILSHGTFSESRAM